MGVSTITLTSANLIGQLVDGSINISVFGISCQVPRGSRESYTNSLSLHISFIQKFIHVSCCDFVRIVLELYEVVALLAKFLPLIFNCILEGKTEVGRSRFPFSYYSLHPRCIKNFTYTKPKYSSSSQKLIKIPRCKYRSFHFFAFRTGICRILQRSVWK